MLYQKDSNKIPKKTAQKLAKFAYYVDTLFSEVPKQTIKTKNEQLIKHDNKQMNKLHSKSTSRKMNYNYLISKSDNLAAVNSESILSSVKKLYLNEDVIKINEMSYGRQGVFADKGAYFGGSGWWREIVDFVLIEGKQPVCSEKVETRNTVINRQERSKYITTNDSKNTPLQSSTKSIIKATHTKPEPTHPKNSNNKRRQYWLYVIHNCSSTQGQSQQQPMSNKILWENFIERYHFVTDYGVKSSKLQQNQSHSENTITYQLLYSYNPTQTNGQSYFFVDQSLTKSFIQSHCKLTKQSNLQSLQKLQGYLLQRSSEVQSTLTRQKDIAFSDEHRRQSKIPVEYFKHYLKLKQQIYQYYLQLHALSSQEQINKYFYQNLVCRYLLAKEYHFQQAKKGIIEYLIWQKQMKQKYPSIQSFKQYHQLGAYQCIGEDFMGRPVLLSKAALIDVNKLPDIETYCDYYIYFLEIHLRQRMRGYVDQMLVIGDLTDLGARNFKLAITKRNLGDSLKYGPERQHALIIVHASTFAYTAWTFIKPLMPKKTLHKIQISGHNKKEIIEALSSRMDIKVIPEYLGGLNQNVDKQFQKKDEKISKPHQQQQIEFVQSRKGNSTNGKIQRVKNDDLNEFQKIEMVTSQSVIVEKKKEQNVLFSFFQSVTQTFGFNIGN